jgi:hypothetical protein
MSGVPITRYAIGLVSMPDELLAALDDLVIDPKPPHPLKAIACREPLAAAFQYWQRRPQDSQTCQWVVSLPATTACPWRFESFEPGKHPGPGIEVNPLPRFPHWVIDRHMRLLDRHLRAGGGLLVAQADSDAVEKVACTKLVRHCSGGIQIHAPSSSR